MSRPPAIAIVGMGLRFAGASTPADFWRLLAGGTDASRDVPAGRWPLPAASVLGAVGAPERVPSARGYYLDAAATHPDLGGLAVDPQLVARLDPLFGLTLAAGRDAWRDGAQTQDRGVDRRRVGVILGNIVLPTSHSSRLSQGRVFADLAERCLGRSAAVPAWEPADAFSAGLPAGLLAQALGLGGGTFTLDAACASSLYALKLATDALQEGRLDAVLTGGVSRPDCFYTQMGFAQLRALAPDGKCYPFDERAAGLVVGEGAGLFVLKRLADAERDGDQIYGLLAGFGLANDLGGGLMAPSSEGQLRAMRAAYAQAGWQPQDVDVIECHATGTPLGDRVELESLARLWAGGTRPAAPGACILGSVKGNVGHLLTAAGASGLAKILLSFKAGSVAPTANFGRPPAALRAADSPFRVLSALEPWPRRAGAPRRAALSGFGFGGINAHVLVEEWQPSTSGARAITRPVSGTDSAGSAGSADGSSHDLDPSTPPRSATVPKGPRQVAIVGAGMRLDGIESFAEFRRSTLGEAPGAARVRGTVDVPLSSFRIPPVELKDLLPQQLLLLLAASEALAAAGLGREPKVTGGVFVGVGLDPATNLYSCRWTVAAQARAWNEAFGLGLDALALDAWTAALIDGFGHELTANRVMGSLGSIVASRVAREFGFGGPSFTVANGDASGLRALELAAGAIRRGELSVALVGAVDLATNGITQAAARALAERRGEAPPGQAADGAVAFVLKDLEAAQAAGDRILAVLEEVVSAGGGLPQPAPAFGPSCYVGAATGLVQLAQGVAALATHVLPGPPARYWLRDGAVGRRRLTVGCQSLDGTYLEVALQEAEASGGSAAAAGEANVHRLDVAAPSPASAATDLRLGAGHGRFGLFVLTSATAAALAGRLADLRNWALDRGRQGASPRALAAAWRLGPGAESAASAGPWRCVLVHEAGRTPLLTQQCDVALNALAALAAPVPADQAEPLVGGAAAAETWADAGVFLGQAATPAPLALLFPGAGSFYAGMGAEFGAGFPGVLDRQDGEALDLGAQLGAAHFWDQAAGGQAFAQPLGQPAILGGQCALACLIVDVLRGFGLQPAAALGYSLGESAALLALRAWPDRQAVYDRLMTSDLFTRQLAGEKLAVRQHWGLPAAAKVDWLNVVVRREPAVVRDALRGLDRAYLNNINTPSECILGGDREQVTEALRRLDHPLLEIPSLPALHCSVIEAVAAEFRAFHDFPVVPPPGVQFYSGASGEPLVLTSDGAADSILRHGSAGVNFPAALSRVYADGARVFLEVGPGATLARLVRQVLNDRPYRLVSLCAKADSELASLYAALAQCVCLGHDLALAPLFADVEAAARPAGVSGDAAPPAMIRVRSGDPVLPSVPPPTPSARPSHHPMEPKLLEPDLFGALLSGFAAAQAATLAAHSTHLRLSQAALEGAAKMLRAYEEPAPGERQAPDIQTMPAGPAAPVAPSRRALRPSRPPLNPEPAWLDYAQCHEYAVGSIGKVLGPEFAAVDAFPTRVRLPDGPLLLCHRIMSVDGVPKSMTAGTLVTEHDVLADAWYLDDGRIPTCVAVEAGQADLFLSGYLGADFHTRGLAVYRLLDAVVTFHDRLPTPGSVIRYVIKISEFFHQGETMLFRFSFEATVDGRRLMTMEKGCAGFFSEGELASGRGIVKTALDLRAMPGKITGSFIPPVQVVREAYDAAQLEALRRGDYAACFGAPFAGLSLVRPKRLPGGEDGGMLRLVHRIVAVEPEGGRYGLGRIVGEADIHPDDWFLTCHFVDDQVMPGTLMYECCMHTLRVFLMRMGWVGEAEDVPCEPVPGIASRLRCRGQVLKTTRQVRYEIDLKELGYGPDAYALADASMVADGKPIVEIADMSIRHLGLTKDKVAALWSRASSTSDRAPAAVVNTAAQILELSTGKPSAAFGPRFAPFDDGSRRLARLPRPPFLFLDSITETTAEPLVMRAGGLVVGTWTAAPDAWFFAAAGTPPRLPLAVLVEAALQPCGWFSSYMGAALTTDADLYYRNLGGAGTLHQPLTPELGTLTNRVVCTGVSSSGGMIIHNFTFAMCTADGAPVYDGEAVFGFFTKAALAQQVGLRQAPGHLRPAATATHPALPFPDKPHMPRRPLLMLDEIVELESTGGVQGLGRIHGRQRVDPAAWFFDAHFYQDPVMPGSLGLEAFQQLLLVLADELWPAAAAAGGAGPALNQRHEWTYRGQVLRTSGVVDVVAEVTAVDPEGRTITADGCLSVDGLPIYAMRGFTVSLVSNGVSQT